MQKAGYSFVAIIASVLLSGCQTTANVNPDTSVPANYRAIVADHYKQALKDPYSVRDAGISAPRREFVGILNGGMRDAVCVKMNAKNSGIR